MALAPSLLPRTVVQSQKLVTVAGCMERCAAAASASPAAAAACLPSTPAVSHGVRRSRACVTRCRSTASLSHTGGQCPAAYGAHPLRPAAGARGHENRHVCLRAGWKRGDESRRFWGLNTEGEGRVAGSVARLSSSSLLSSLPSSSSSSSRSSSATSVQAMLGGGRDSVVEFSANLQTNIALEQHPQATFDEYLKDADRVFAAFFPDTQRFEKLGEHTWRIHMLPIEFFFISVQPVVDFDLLLDVEPDQAKYRGAKSVMNLTARRWELRGVDYDPNAFALTLKGALYTASTGFASSAMMSSQSRSYGPNGASSSSSSSSASSHASASSFSSSSSHSSSQSQFQSSSTSQSQSQFQFQSSLSSTPSQSQFQSSSSSIAAVATPRTLRSQTSRRPSSFLRGGMEARVSMTGGSAPPGLPVDSIQALGSAVLSQLLGSMKDKVNSRVIADYRAFVRETLKDKQ